MSTFTAICDHQNPQGQAPALLALATNARRALSRVLAANAPPREELPPLPLPLPPNGIPHRSRVPNAESTIKADSLVALREVLGSTSVAMLETETSSTRGARVSGPAQVKVSKLVGNCIDAC